MNPVQIALSESVEEVRSRLAFLVENSADAIIGKTLEGIIISWNPAAERMFGYTAAEIIGRPLELLIPQDHPGEEAEILANLRRGKSVRHFRTARLRKDGSRFDVSVTISPIRDFTGKVVSASKILRDMSARSGAENASASTDQSYLSLIEATTSITWQAQPNGELRDEQPSWSAFTGQTSAELRGWGWLNAVHPADRAEVKQTWEKTTSTCTLYQAEYRLRKQDLTFRHMRVRAVPKSGSDGKVLYWIGVHIDITESIQGVVDLQAAEYQLHALVERLHTAREEEAKRIARELHDDLGQRLTALNMEIYVFEEGLADTTAKQAAQFERMHAGVTHTIEAMQKIASGLRLGQIDILGLAAAVESTLAEFSRLSGISCRISRLDEIVNLSDAGSTTIFRILQEALTNVVRHSQATEVEISLQSSPKEVTLVVRDNGRGITSLEANGKGAIGLLGMRERVQMVRGEITITGIPGIGTTLLVKIPRMGNTLLAA